MRCLLTGMDTEGRSCVVEESEVAPAPVEGISGISLATLYRTSQSPPPARPPALAAGIDVQLAPGLVRCFVIEHESNATHNADKVTAEMHHSDTLDFAFVQQGSAQYLLQDGVHEVRAGDCIVTPGVDHAWRAGPGGCRLVVFSIGTPPPDRAP
jgi:mannose-6-phosphate isomerase-like protein (cupin superfamily)